MSDHVLSDAERETFGQRLAPTELQRQAVEAFRKVREAARRWVRLADEFDHDLTCTGESFEDVRTAINDFDRACEDSIAAQDAARVLPEFRE